MIVYFNGDFLPKELVRISPDDRGFLFADGAYEVIRSYDGRLFKLQAHLQRLENSLQALHIAAPDTGKLQDAAAQLLQHNALTTEDAALYVQVTRGVAPRKHAFPPSNTPPTIYLTASPFRASPEKWEQGVRIILLPDMRWSRCDIKSVALLPNVLANQQAKESGAHEAVFVRKGTITEGSHTNFAAVFDGRLITHPRTHHILPGITREIVLDLCRELDLSCSESPIREAKLREASELMLLGTTTEIMPVVQVDDWQVGNGQPGPVTRTLQRAFRTLVASEPLHGKTPA
jgi:D-alanine transaminase